MNVQATAQDADRQSEAFLRDVAKEFDAAVMAGVVGPMVNGLASNEAVAFAPDGSELVRYRKMQLFTPLGEEKLFAAGRSHQIFECVASRSRLSSAMTCGFLRFFGRPLSPALS